MKLMQFGSNYFVTDLTIAGTHHSIVIQPGSSATVSGKEGAVALPSNWMFVGLICKEPF